MATKKTSKKNKSSKNKRKTSLEVNKDEYLKLKPIKSPFVKIKEKKEEELLIELDISEFKKRKMINKLIPTPNFKKILLDKLGSDVFLLCDGNHRIKDIIKKFQDEYQLTPTETELSIKKYLMTLTEKNLIGYIIPKEIAKKNNLENTTVEKVILDSN
ncbi:MAG: PqqD family protein [Candidatus Hodarchaeales archaeon]